MMQIEPEQELALIKRAGAGDHEAFGHLVSIYEGKLLAYLAQMLGDSESARDLAQETFIAVFHTLPQWHMPVYSSELSADEPAEVEGHRQLLAPWLYRIATNRAISLLRKQQVRQRVHAPSIVVNEHAEPAEGQAESALPPQESFEEHYIARTLLQEALKQLSELDAACLVLHYVNGERYQEIAERVGLSSGAVRKRVARALPVLRQAYLALDSEVNF